MGILKHKSIQRSLYVVAILFVVGLGLQAFLGSFDLTLLEYPCNIIIISAILLFAIVMCKCQGNHPVTRFLCSGAAALSALLFIGIQSLILGLTLQTPDTNLNDIPSLLGIRQMTSYYPFITSYLYLLVTLSFISTKRLSLKFDTLNIGFFLNHAGLLILLTATGLGAADKKELRVSIMEGHKVDKALDRHNKSADLPFTIALKDFSMQTYMPKLVLVNTETKRFIPDGKPEFWDIDTTKSSFSLQGYRFEIKQYLSNAVKVGNIFAESEDIAAPPAVKVCTSDKHQSAWVSCGNSEQVYTMMLVDKDVSLAMLTPEPKEFASELTILQDGTTKDARVAVNKPLHIGMWSIYQTTYDEKAGKASKLSGLQLIYDPWQRLIQLGFGMLILGAITLFWGYGTKNEKHGLE